MTEAETLLKMIEGVDPKDTATLDEIDARFMAWAHIPSDSYKTAKWVVKWEAYEARKISERWAVSLKKEDGTLGAWWRPKKFTRSRDAIKAVRPEGWQLVRVWWHPKTGFEFSYIKENKNGGINALNPIVRTYGGATECLAELHAIIQAIEFNRTQKQ